jgi:pimeloyl-ACP methyl ester carboxylesterase
MKKILNTLFALFLAITTLGNLTAQPTRKLHLLHGFGGNASSWEKYDNYFQNTLNLPVTTNRFSYNTSAGLVAGAEDAFSKMQPSSNPNLDFVIAHSFGGLVTREIERTKGADDFGGYITFGTPHRGTGLANAYGDGRLAAFFNELCNESITEPLESVVPIGPSSISEVNNLSELVCSFIWNQYILGQFSDFVQPASINDLKVDNPRLQTLNSYQSTKPRIAVYADEDSPAHWREITNLNDGLPDVLGETADSKIGNQMKLLRDVERVISVMSFVRGILTLNPIRKAKLFKMGKEFRQGYQTIDATEAKWDAMLGSGSFATNTVTQTEFICRDELEALLTLLETQQITWQQFSERRSRLMCDPNCFRQVTTTIYVHDGGAHDGIVPVYSQASLPGATQISVVGVNHQEFLNHPNITAQMNNILNGTAGVTFFDLI